MGVGEITPEFSRPSVARIGWNDLLCTEVDMRDQIWDWLRAKHPEGMLLTRWLLIVRAILYPLDFFYWRMSLNRGYHLESDTWTIYGVRYSGNALRQLAKAQGETYRVSREGETVTLERVHNAALSGWPCKETKETEK